MLLSQKPGNNRGEEPAEPLVQTAPKRRSFRFQIKREFEPTEQNFKIQPVKRYQVKKWYNKYQGPTGNDVLKNVIKTAQTAKTTSSLALEYSY